MYVEIEKLTGLDLLHEAIQFTSGHRFEPINKIKKKRKKEKDCASDFYY